MELENIRPAKRDSHHIAGDLSAFFQPITIAGLTLANRFVMPGMQRGWCIDGHAPERLADYYAARARGGVQLIITECIAVDQPSATRTRKYGRLAEDTADSWARCVDAVHDAGAHFFPQIGHDGALLAAPDGDYFASAPILSPSGLMKPGTVVGSPATVAELEAVRDAFVRSARIAKRIGADGVEIHACHGYLLDQFLWTDTNIRNDKYGGSDMLNRVRFPAEVVRAVRDEVGSDFVISVRLSQWKLQDYTARVAATPDELSVMLHAFDEAGVDFFHASTRRFGDPEWPESQLGLAGWIRKLSGKPVIAVGGVGLTIDMVETFSGKDTTAPPDINFPALAKRFNANEFDLIAVGRSIIADSDWVAKVRDGRSDLIRQFKLADLGDVAEEARQASTKAS
ncbi:flavin oxidoreductase / NADH oxidase family protein [Burkholderia cenocepacia]|uniref:Flavin oxidoreductase / NADH oxidase family protein n=1 Tax=Burkholderia cenocepacia TaxID=95486 RepID=A0AAN0RYN9_9BURK|nr:flavin oxidoreductase / NADH oxidase family protein [Burkholderia cenocepacia]